MRKTPQTLKGFRDFLPEEKIRRDFVMGKVLEVFKKFGFEPLETPTLEYASLLLGKYGEEADKLVYTFKDQGDREIGLRYDQTVPTARVLAQYQGMLPKYFRRYQVQNVFRAEKPQKGRYREFTQCDIDIFGSTSPTSDAEIVACTYFAFENVGYPNIVIKINDRQVLLENLKPFEKDGVSTLSIIQSIDKLDKKSKDEVVSELIKKGLDQNDAKKAIESIENATISKNLQSIIDSSVSLGVPEENIRFTPELARGLDYYTGMIFEVIIPEYPVGSFGGGGRYDNLIEQLGGNKTPAVGIAFGFDRMVEAAQELELIPANNLGSQVLITLFPGYENKSLKAASKLRKAGIKTEVFTDPDKLGKQFKYANTRKIPYVLVIGEDEAKNNKVTLKNMDSGDQEVITLDDVISRLT
ncbi:histidine--tRNA ligase [Patescibacteria group bacterium]